MHRSKKSDSVSSLSDSEERMVSAEGFGYKNRITSSGCQNSSCAWKVLCMNGSTVFMLTSRDC